MRSQDPAHSDSGAYSVEAISVLEGLPRIKTAAKEPSAEDRARAEWIRINLDDLVSRSVGTSRISQEERARRQEILEKAAHNNLMSGIKRDPATDPIFEAFVRGDIDVTDIKLILDRLRDYKEG